MTVLERILAVKAREIKALRTDLDRLRHLAQAAPAPRPFVENLRGREPVALIAEIKKASPSKGVIAQDFDPIRMAAAYEEAGAHALSILTDREHFQGSPEILRAVRSRTSLPILRKDFIIDEAQVFEARAIGADAVLLIAAALSSERLAQLLGLVQSLRMDALVEVHTLGEWERVAPLRPTLVGVNNRDLSTFEVDLATTERLAAHIPRDALLVSESGISARGHVQRVQAAGAQAVLVGESLMRSGPGAVREEVRRLFAKEGEPWPL